MRFRFSRNPSKQLLWLWLARDMQRLRGRRGLDAACGLMENRRFFQTETYFGFDADANRLDIAKKQNPDVEAVHMQISDASKEHESDVVLCVQTLGANKFFDHTATLDAVQSLIEVTKAGGSLILNVGAKSSHAGLLDILRRSFETVTVRRYGGYNAELPVLLSLLVACAFFLFPAIRGSKKIYCLCQNKVLPKDTMRENTSGQANSLLEVSGDACGADFQSRKRELEAFPKPPIV